MHFDFKAGSITLLSFFHGTGDLLSTTLESLEWRPFNSKPA